MAKEHEEPEVKVTDRRRFSPEGEPLDTGKEEEEPPASHEQASTARDPGAARETAPLPPPTFEFLVLSFRWQAELQLGLYGAEKDSERMPDLEGARHSIDMLGVLQEKTRGNLTLEEQRLLDNSLTELRFRYVQAVEKFAKKA
jgi:hypothetical protein